MSPQSNNDSYSSLSINDFDIRGRIFWVNHKKATCESLPRIMKNEIASKYQAKNEDNYENEETKVNRPFVALRVSTSSDCGCGDIHYDCLMLTSFGKTPIHIRHSQDEKYCLRAAYLPIYPSPHDDGNPWIHTDRENYRSEYYGRSYIKTFESEIIPWRAMKFSGARIESDGMLILDMWNNLLGQFSYEELSTPFNTHIKSEIIAIELFKDIFFFGAHPWTIPQVLCIHASDD